MQSVSHGRHMFILDVTAFYIITVMKISRVLISVLRYILHYFMAVMKKIWGLLVLYKVIKVWSKEQCLNMSSRTSVDSVTPAVCQFKVKSLYCPTTEL